MSVKPRSVTPIIEWWRNFLRNKKMVDVVHRYEMEISPRSVPAAILPDGAAHVLSNNYYYDRDGRRQNMPDMSVYSATAAKAITAGGDKSAAVTANTAAKVPKPGFGYDWNTGGPSYKS